MKRIHDLDAALRTRSELQHTVILAQSEQREHEAAIVAHLIERGLTDYFTVNWTKLNRHSGVENIGKNTLNEPAA